MCRAEDAAFAQYHPGGRRQRPPATARPTRTPTESDAAGTDSTRPDRLRAAKAEEARLARLFAAALENPATGSVLDRIVALGRLHPDAMTRGIDSIELAANTNAPGAASAALALHALFQRLGETDRANRQLDLMTAKHRGDVRVLEYVADRAFARGAMALGREHLALAVEHAVSNAERARLMRQLRNAHLDAGDTALTLRLPGDAVLSDKLVALAVKRGDIARAIELTERQLNRLPSFDPLLARRSVEFAVRAKRDDLAAGYARRWVEAAPTDPNAWLTYARLLREQRGPARASARDTLSHAYQLNRDRHDIALELSDWDAQDGRTQASLEGLLSILRHATEEGLLMQSALRAIPLGATLGLLEQVELALRSASTRLVASEEFRGALLDVYSSLIRTARLEQKSMDAATRTRAIDLLHRVGQRAGATLVAILTDRTETRPGLALELLSQVQPRGIGHELLTFAAGAGASELRTEAALLAGRFADPTLLSHFATLLDARALGTFSSPIVQAAAFGVSRIRSAQATAILRALLRRGSPDLRGLAALWLAERNDRSVISDLLAARRNHTDSAAANAAIELALMQLGAMPPPIEDFRTRHESRIE